ncbi:MAG: branched-chain amino acid ABC transporter substrate-binding protein [Proteobacteria bacterium]|nr:branched-chain amino acid ABC transporter substrate-binding protein [Pseudomonadota bacterium]MBU1695482.1 branched-chain amino acid ABC transporter substrate-binding protein [Pseudomonadota bacterium]
MKNLIRVFIAICFLLSIMAVPAVAGNAVTLQKGEPVHLAYWFVTSGPNTSLGMDSLRGAEIAIEDFGGKLKGHPIKLSGQDSMCGPEGGQAAASKIASDPSVIAAIGSSCSSAAKAGVPILWKMGIPNVSPSNTAPLLTDPASGPDFDGYLRTCHNDNIQGAIAAEFAYSQLGLKKVATIHDGSVYAESLQQVFSDTFRKLGGTVTSQEAVSPGDTDMRPVLTKIASGGPQFLYYPMFIAESGHVTRQSKEVSGLENIALMSADGSFSPDFLKAAGKAADGMYHSSPDFSALGDSYTKFLAKHKAKYGMDPEAPFHAHTYDAVMLILNAIDKVAVVSGDTLTIDRMALNKAMHETKGQKGLTGDLTCDENGDCANPKIAIYKTSMDDIKAGKMSPIPFWKKY